ncbi:MAG TPA: DegT/DnrJ/EryC1/StrS aminotransferase family protein [Candidatus Sulfotelmatobacter sp.]|nr:DegT/DnrJ/EryC1/StrS aminotransferase family protein [Candidatus Sulfotelmatobacter sp.]
MKIPLSKPDIGEREIEYVTHVLRSGQLSLGPRLAEFEREFAAYAGTRFAVATNSGTSALHLCVRALGIGAADEVLTTSFSFVASSNCLLYERALPSFVDIDPGTFNLDPVALRETIARDCTWERVRRRLVNRRTGRIVRAILPVHVFGMPCEMAPIIEVAREFHLRVIEDACEALGAEHCGRHVGTFGDAAAFAFYPNKQMTTAEGGMVATNDARVAALCRSMRNQGRDEDGGWIRHVRLGYNYRLSDLHCALGLAQLERIEELLAARARVAQWYATALATLPHVALPPDSGGLRRSWFAYVIQLAGGRTELDRDHLMAGLRDRGIASQAYFQPIHRQPYFRETVPGPLPALPETEAAAERCLALPFFSSMTQDQVMEVGGALRELLAESRPGVERMPAQYSRANQAAD